MRVIQKVLSGKRITIPAEVLEKLGINEGDYVIIEWEDENFRIIPAEVRPRRSLKNG